MKDLSKYGKFNIINIFDLSDQKTINFNGRLIPLVNDFIRFADKDGNIKVRIVKKREFCTVAVILYVDIE